MNQHIKFEHQQQADRMAKNIYVKAPGITKTHTFTRLICPTTAKFEDYLKFEDIPDMIKGSESLSVSVIGDILGPSLKSGFSQFVS